MEYTLKQMTGGRDLLCKVPEITIFFWIIQILCTTVGETASDFLNVNLNMGLTYTSFIMGAILDRENSNIFGALHKRVTSRRSAHIPCLEMKTNSCRATLTNPFILLPKVQEAVNKVVKETFPVADEEVNDAILRDVERICLPFDPFIGPDNPTVNKFF